MDVRSTLSIPINLLRLRIQVVMVTPHVLISLICLGLGLRGGPAPTLTVISNKPIRRAIRYPRPYRIAAYPTFCIRQANLAMYPIALDTHQADMGMAPYG